MSRRQRILFVIASDLYVRNYMDSGVLKSLHSDYELYFAVRSSLALSASVSSRFPNVSRYTLTRSGQRKGQLIFDVMMLRYAKKSPSFAFRASSVYPALRFGLQTRRPWRKLIREQRRKTWLTLLSQGPVFKLFKRAYVDPSRVNASLEQEVDRVRPDLVVVPSSGYTIDAIDAVKICRARGIGSLFLIDNWDNLSSKSILWERPDHVAVWGEQSKEHAIDIHGFNPEQVSLIGTPRFDSYLALRAQKLPSHFSFPYVLFVGTALPFDEPLALQRLDEELERYRDVYGDLKIIYRPHPWRWSKDSVLDLGLKHVVVDPQMVENYARGKGSKAFQPSLDYYPSLLSNAVFALGGISSMLMEAAVFAKHYLVIAYDEPMNLYSPKRIYDEHLHFRGIEKLPGLVFCDQLEDLASRFRFTFEQAKDPLDFAAVDREREYFLHMDEQPYGERLRALLQSQLANSRAVALGSQ